MKLSLFLPRQWKSSNRNNKKITGIIAPNNADAKRTEKALNPNTQIGRIEAYEYPAGVYKNDSRCKGSTFPVMSFPVFNKEKAL